MKKGFSLIELLIYTGLFAVAAGLLTGITLTVTRVQTQESAGLEVTRQSQFIMQRIQNLVRESSLVEDGCEGKISSFSPLPSCPSSKCTGDFCFLKLRTEVSGADPTYIYIPSGTDGVYLKQGSSDAVALTTDKVKVGMLKFSTIGNPGGHSIVNVDLTLNYNSTNPILSGASKRLTSAVSRVSAATFDSNLLPNANNTLSIGAAGTTWKNILMVDGTAATPSYSFGASSTTGIFSPGTGIIGFSTGGSERMRIDVSGNVGIGTTAPQSTLSIGSANFRLDRSEASPNAGYIRFGDSSGWKFHIGRSQESSGGAFDTGITGVLMTVQDNGNVGIGTTTPAEKLEVSGNIKLSGATPTYRITNLAEPSVASDVATKNYVDTQTSAGGTPILTRILSGSNPGPVVAQTGFTISGIPSGNERLLLVVSFKETFGGAGVNNYRLRFNSDSGSNYYGGGYYHSSPNASLTFISAATSTSLNVAPFQYSADTWQSIEVEIFNKLSYRKLIWSNGTQTLSTTSVMRAFMHGSWNNTTNEISSIALFADGSNNFNLYDIKYSVYAYNL